ncbi:MAG: hypothetical protein SH856_09405 [Flavobacteriales bacterium]|nr:hypothetical protein [Flavobacteriales bacterium]
MESLCKLLRCLPSDQFAWTPDDSTENVLANPLQSIGKKDLPNRFNRRNRIASFTPSPAQQNEYPPVVAQQTGH